MKRIMLIIAALSFIASATAQENTKTTFHQLSDSLWSITEPGYGGRIVSHYATPVDHALLTADLNNRIRRSAGLQAGGILLGGLSAATGIAWSNGKGEIFKTVAVFTGLGAVIMECASLINLFPERIVVTPNGVTLKIDTSKQKDKKQTK